MEELTIELNTKVDGREMKAIITCRTREEYDALCSDISTALLAWAEKYHPFPDLAKRYTIGVETTEGTAPFSSTRKPRVHIDPEQPPGVTPLPPPEKW